MHALIDEYPYIKRNYDELVGEIAELGKKYCDAAPRLVCVTKSGADEELLALCAAGAKEIGENRPQELKRRAELLTEHGFSPLMHEIGTLQRNKVKLVADRAALIHSVDSIKLARDISRHAVALGRRIPVLIEVNSACEAAKGGVLPEEAEALLCELYSLGGIVPSGLMTMGPVCDEAEGLRPYFRRTRQLFDSLRERYDLGTEPILSMGMSDSYAVAIEEGSTLVRVGRRLFNK